MSSNLSVTPQAAPFANKVLSADVDATVCANATGTTGVLYLADIDNTGNALETLYLKLYDDAAPTVGTSDPNWIFKIKGGERKTYAIPDGIAFDVALSFAAVQSPGTPGTTGPSSPIPVTFLTT